MNAVVAMVVFGVTPCVTVVGHAVNCGAPTVSTLALAGKESGIIATEDMSRTRIAAVIAFELSLNCIFLKSPCSVIRLVAYLIFC